MYYTLFSDLEGNLIKAPDLYFLGRSGSQWVEPEEGDLILLPEGSSLTMMPGHHPVGLNSNNEAELREKTENGAVIATACLLPQGFTRTLLPAAVSPPDSAQIPILGYTALAGRDGAIFAAAVPTDDHHKWHPRHYNLPFLEDLVHQRLRQFPANRILRQLAHCSLHYSCYTAQNIFMQRWEGGIPTTPSCNARCLGCISESHIQTFSPQERLSFVPALEEVVEVGLHHLQGAEESIVSFGQGCEGDPCTNSALIARAISKMRTETDRGSINCNTNAGNFSGVKEMVDAGLDAMRVTFLSAIEKDYIAYHCPINYKLQDVIDSMRYAHDQGVFVSLNLLTMPGFTDSEEQVEKLLLLVKEVGIPMIQLRNLNLDPDFFFNAIPLRSKALGVRKMMEELTRARVKLASYSHPAQRGKGLLKA
ncbi:MAG: radical SAM protein [Syntrophomonadaceae bacterium]|nr:radical SAM protein [Syntrophomonadaceae bacterium]